MLCNINQKNTKLNLQIQGVGCLFLCFAYCSPLIFSGTEGCIALNLIYSRAKDLGYIDTDGTVLDHNGVMKLFYLDAKYDGVHHKPDEKIPETVSFLFGKYKYNTSHFVVLNKNKEIMFDSLITSGAVKYGKLESMRWYHSV